MAVWLFIKGLTRFIPAKAAMWGVLTAIAGAVVIWLRRDAVADDRQSRRVAGLEARLKANEIKEDAENEAEQKSDADLISDNTRGV